MNDIHNNLAPITPTFFTIFDWIVLGILIVGLGVILWFWFANKKRVNTKSVEKITKKKFVPQQFIFKKELDNIVRLQSQKKWKDFALKSSILLKKLLERGYKSPFDFATGKEVQEIMAHKNISDLQKRELKYFFDLIDPIKFAKATGKEEIAREVVNILKEFNKK